MGKLRHGGEEVPKNPCLVFPLKCKTEEIEWNWFFLSCSYTHTHTTMHGKSVKLNELKILMHVCVVMLITQMFISTRKTNFSTFSLFPLPLFPRIEMLRTREKGGLYVDGLCFTNLLFFHSWNFKAIGALLIPIHRMLILVDGNIQRLKPNILNLPFFYLRPMPF